MSKNYSKNLENTTPDHWKLRKKIRKFGLKTAEYKKKVGSNIKKLRKLEPQQKQRILIKKKEWSLDENEEVYSNNSKDTESHPV